MLAHAQSTACWSGCQAEVCLAQGMEASVYTKSDMGDKGDDTDTSPTHSRLSRFLCSDLLLTATVAGMCSSFSSELTAGSSLVQLMTRVAHLAHHSAECPKALQHFHLQVL